MNLNFLVNEELINLLKVLEKEGVPLYKNPSKKELEDSDLYSAYSGNVRFAIHHIKNVNDVYVWNADIPHYKAYKDINVEYPHSPDTLFGEASKDKYGFDFVAQSLISLQEEISENKDYKYVEHILKINWTNKYIDVVMALRKIARRLPKENLERVKQVTPWLEW